jgi:putative oxidoreductase
VLPLVIRLTCGPALVGFGLGKFVDHAQELQDFRGFGVPLPEVSVYVAGVIELVGGMLLIVGLLTRVAALAVALNLVGALLTAGLTEGGTFHLVVGPTLLALMLVLVGTGAGALSLDGWLVHRYWSRVAQPASNTS